MTLREVLAKGLGCEPDELEELYNTTTFFRPLAEADLLDAEVVPIPGDRPVVVPREAVDRVAHAIHALFEVERPSFPHLDEAKKEPWRLYALSCLRALFPKGVYRAKAVGRAVLGPTDLTVGYDKMVMVKSGDLVAVLEE